MERKIGRELLNRLAGRKQRNKRVIKLEFFFVVTIQENERRGGEGPHIKPHTMRDMLARCITSRMETFFGSFRVLISLDEIYTGLSTRIKFLGDINLFYLTIPT